MANWWDKYASQDGAAPPSEAAPAGNWWDKYRGPAASPVEGITGIAPMPDAGRRRSVLFNPDAPAIDVSMGPQPPPPPAPLPGGDADMLLPGVPGTPGAFGPGGRMPSGVTPATPAPQPYDFPSAVKGLQQMEYAADPTLFMDSRRQGPQMTPEERARWDRLHGVGTAGVVNMTDEGLYNSLKQIYPDAQLFKDELNNPILVVNGKPFYLNPPGIDTTEFARYAPSISMGVTAAGTLGRLIPGLLPRMATVGVTEAGLSAGLDTAARWTGSDMPISGERMAWAAGAGAGGELAGWVVGKILQQFGKGAATVMTNPGTGAPIVRWSPEAQAALQAANIDPTALGAEWVAQFNRDFQRTLLPDEAIRHADLATLPTPVSYSRGDITRLPSDQMTESLMYKGAYGPMAQDRFKTLRMDQQAQLAANAGTIAGRMGGVGAVDNPGIGAAITSEMLNRLRTGMAERTNQLYAAARASDTGGIDIATGRGMAFDLASGRDLPDLIEFAPKTQAMLRQFDEMLTRAGNGELMIRPMMDWRRRVTNLAGTESDRTERTALTALRRNYDDAIQRMVEGSLFRGDDASIARWTEAIGSRRELGRLFEGNDIIEALTELEQRGGRRVLAVPPDQAANYIFGIQGLGAGKIDLARDLARVRDVLRGPPMASEAERVSGEAAWNALREEAWGRLVRSAEGPFNESTSLRGFSGAKFASTVDGIMKANPSLMRTLFSPQELAQIEQLKRAALAVTTTVRGGDNASNTSVGLANLFQNIFAGPLKAIAGAAFGPNSLLGSIPLGNLLTTPVGAGRAALRTSGSVTTQAPPFAGLLGGALGQPGFYVEPQGLLGVQPQGQ